MPLRGMMGEEEAHRGSSPKGWVAAREVGSGIPLVCFLSTRLPVRGRSAFFEPLTDVEAPNVGK